MSRLACLARPASSVMMRALQTSHCGAAPLAFSARSRLLSLCSAWRVPSGTLLELASQRSAPLVQQAAIVPLGLCRQSLAGVARRVHQAPPMRPCALQGTSVLRLPARTSPRRSPVLQAASAPKAPRPPPRARLAPAAQLCCPTHWCAPKAPSPRPRRPRQRVPTVTLPARAVLLEHSVRPLMGPRVKCAALALCAGVAPAVKRRFRWRLTAVTRALQGIIVPLGLRWSLPVPAARTTLCRAKPMPRHAWLALWIPTIIWKGKLPAGPAPPQRLLQSWDHLSASVAASTGTSSGRMACAFVNQAITRSLPTGTWSPRQMVRKTASP